MTRILLVGVLLGLVSPVHAQDTPAVSVVTYRTTGSRVAVGRDVHIQRDEEVRDAVVVVGGSVTVDGRVRDGIVVVGGDLHLGAAAEVRGDVVLAGGVLTRADGSRLLGSVSTLSFGEWARGFAPFQWLPTLQTVEFGRWLRLPGTAGRITALALFAAVMLLVARAPLARIGRAAAAAPVRAGMIGLTAVLLFVPVLLLLSIALGITIIGLPFVLLLVPLTIVIAVVALLLGFTAVACRIGEWVAGRLGWRLNSAWLATAIGMLIVLGPTIVSRLLSIAPGPLQVATGSLLIIGIAIEFVVWTVGLGATLTTGFGRWNTTPPPLGNVITATHAERGTS